jgi:hypothetical protein
MTKIAESTVKLDEVLKMEWDKGYNRDEITIAAGQDTVLIATTLLGKITSSGEFTPLNPTATDGSEVVAGILTTPLVDATTTTAKAMALVRGPATVRFKKITLKNALDETQILKAKNDLQIFNPMIKVI